MLAATAIYETIFVFVLVLVFMYNMIYLEFSSWYLVVLCGCCPNLLKSVGRACPKFMYNLVFISFFLFNKY